MKATDRDVSTNAPLTGASAQSLPGWLSRDWFWALILILAVILAYQPVWRAGFMWDDDMFVSSNACIVGPLGLKEIWTTKAARFYPLVLTTFWLEHAVWGVAPRPYHLVNVFLHATCAVVLWRVLRNLEVRGAWLGAALWALHPVQVETGAWISEMKNTESCLFYLLTILFFVKGLKAGNPGQRTGGNWNDALALLFGAMAMASKSSTLLLPVVLALCAWWVKGRWHWRDLARVGPFLLMTITAAFLTMQVVRGNGADELHWAPSWPERLATGGDVFWFYLGKLLWPYPLITFYPPWEIDAGHWISYVPIVSVALVLSLLWLKRESWSRPYLFAFAYYLALLLPVLGLFSMIGFRYSLVEDHLQYLASMGPLALAGAELTRFSNFAMARRPWLQSTLCAGLLLILGILSWRQAWIFEDEHTLWTYNLAHNPNCWLAYDGLGVEFINKGEVDEAIELYQKSLAINPNWAKTHYNLGSALLQKGEVDEAIEQFQKALKTDPNSALAHDNLGTTFFHKGQVDKAIEQFQKALKIDPNSAKAHNNLGLALGQKGQADEAMDQFQKALAINPDYAEAHNNLGIAFAKKGQADEAMAQFQEALRLRPDDRAAQVNLEKIKAIAQKKAASP